MVLEIVGCKEEVRSKVLNDDEAKRTRRKTKTKSNKVPFIYWAKFVTLQGNLVNAPFAVGLVNKFLAFDCLFNSLCFAAFFHSSLMFCFTGGDLLSSNGTSKLAPS